MMRMTNSATASPSPNVTVPTTSATVRMAKAPLIASRRVP
jgi:hypothetical protein